MMRSLISSAPTRRRRPLRHQTPTITTRSHCLPSSLAARSPPSTPTITTRSHCLPRSLVAKLALTTRPSLTSTWKISLNDREIPDQADDDAAPDGQDSPDDTTEDA
ncbi:hypothetical protein CGCVW01_v014399 [Colletotrichum viniferum]|nr:hypothetical protein CGCVW01_v014399 [Colletotrichum viniferum]